MIVERERLTAAVGSGFHATYKYLIYQHWLALAVSLGVWMIAKPDWPPKFTRIATN